MTYCERLMRGTKEDLINELVLAIKWARNLSEADWNAITTGSGGLEKFVCDTLDNKSKESALNECTCEHAHGMFQDHYGTRYWCAVYGKECDNCRMVK